MLPDYVIGKTQSQSGVPPVSLVVNKGLNIFALQ